MTARPDQNAAFPESAELLLVVVGAHLRAELEDRPVAMRLRNLLEHWLVAHAPEDRLTPLVCTDLWHLNAAELRNRPAIAIGGPEVNATTAYLANRLPSAMVIEGRLRMHLDPEYVTAQAAFWGTSAEATDAAVTLFAERYMDEFLRTAVTLTPYID